jgi:septal ring factor EnvC (AmiA/AmiB activator)
MVNKGSFFQRLKERWGSGSGVRVDARGDMRSDTRNGGLRPRPGDKPLHRAEPEPIDPHEARALSSRSAAADVRSQRKMSEREEALLALGTHFQELTTMLRGSHARVDDQLSKIVSATSSLPALSQQQVELLQKLSTQIDKQNTLGEQVATTMTQLPALLQSVEGALARAAANARRRRCASSRRRWTASTARWARWCSTAHRA